MVGTQRQGKRFSNSKKPVTAEIVKGVLLATADQILSTLSEIIMENAQNDKGRLLSIIMLFATYVIICQ